MVSAIVNVEMAAAWDGPEGDDWARDWERYDRAVRGYHLALLDAAAIGRADRVLDVGCGNGESTRDAARGAVDGDVLGVDLSSRMIKRARQLAVAAGLSNVSFERADAQVHPFEPGGRDIALSRFGAMFFADPVAAFANVGSALRSGGRLVIVGWRGVTDNEWLQSVFSALAPGRPLPVPPPGAPGPFGLADPNWTRATLSAAGFANVDVTLVDAPFYAGKNGDDAFRFLRSTGVARGLIQGLADDDRARALATLRETVIAHETGDGVLFDSGAWLITARWERGGRPHGRGGRPGRLDEGAVP